MNINRNNYEEFFLLYADNELSAAEKNAVEAFVASNPDLRDELQMFCDTVLIPEPEIVFNDKSSLYKEDGFINRQNYEEIFVLYHDNELTAEQKIQAEQFLIDHPVSQKLFVELKQSKLEPEVISFGDKSSLYRKERTGRIIPVNFWRAAAAIIIAISLYGGWSYFNRPQTNDIATNQQTKEAPAVPQLVEQTEDPTNNANDVTAQNTDKSTGMSGTKDVLVVDEKHSAPKLGTLLVKETREQKPELIKEENKQVEENDVASNNLPKVSNEVINSRNSVGEPSANDYSLSGNISIGSNEIEAGSNDVAGATQASFNPEEEVNKDNYVFYNIREEKFKKSKVGIFLRKAKRVVTRNTFLSGSKGKIASVDVATDK